MKWQKLCKFCFCGGFWLTTFLFVSFFFLTFLTSVVYQEEYPHLLDEGDDGGFGCNSMSDVINEKISYWNCVEGLIIGSMLLFLVLCVAPCICCQKTRRYLTTKLHNLDYDTPIVSEISKVPQATETPKRALGGLATIIVFLLVLFAVPYFIGNYELSNDTITTNTEDAADVNGYFKFQIWYNTQTYYSCSNVQVECRGELTWECSDSDDMSITGTCFAQVLWQDSNALNQALKISIPTTQEAGVYWAIESYICGKCGGPECCDSITTQSISELRTFQDEVLCNQDWATESSAFTISLTPQATCKYDSSLPVLNYAEFDKTVFLMDSSHQTSESFSLTVVAPAFSLTTCYMEDSDLIDLLLRIVGFLGSMLGIRTIIRKAFVMGWECFNKCGSRISDPLQLEEEEAEEEFLMSTKHS